MKLSFLKPRPKYIVAKITKIWIFYIFISLVIIFGFLLILKTQIALSHKRIDEYQSKQTSYQDKISKLQAYQGRILSETDLLKNRQVHNLIVRDAIKNLFNIVPDQITIDYIEVGNDFLKISGSTPSKEVFKFLLQDPLKAIFGKSMVSFFALSNGWYHFVSISQSVSSIIDLPKEESNEDQQ
ncbi:hypothetical protein BKH41_08385 [Helicobacter sp. 12S02232-10]|uniref:hypothetical protein n=1 Tax=Helicobacter sp. 12S02232-10 TaxID=1476197 RepID=UPI000BA7412D|nr:hypothetical protein [Helicobacter sp. 12S02232-10]PAF46876.1 hypothetical protein BKH41_08385 [Helicobacter sp. 12S02232-10]